MKIKKYYLNYHQQIIYINLLSYMLIHIQILFLFLYILNNLPFNILLGFAKSVVIKHLSLPIL